MAAASSRSLRGAPQAGCRTFFVADVAEGAPRARGCADGHHLRAQRAACPVPRPRLRDINLQPVINSTTELAEWDAFVSQQQLARRRGAACRHRHEPARPHARRGRGDRPAHPVGEARLHAADEPFRLRRDARPPAERPADPAVSRNPHAVSRHSLLARQFRRHLSRAAPCTATWCGPASRCYGGNPTPGRQNPMRPVVELKGRIMQVRNVEKGDSVGYGATWTGGATEPHRHRRGRLRRRLSCARPAPRKGKPAARGRSWPASAARSSGASRWT